MSAPHPAAIAALVAEERGLLLAACGSGERTGAGAPGGASAAASDGPMGARAVGAEVCALHTAAAAWSATLASHGLEPEAERARGIVRALDLARLRATARGAEREREQREQGQEAQGDAAPPSFDTLLAVDELLQDYAQRPRALTAQPGVLDDTAVFAEARVTRDAVRAHLAGAVLRGAVHATDRARWVELAIDAADESLFAAGEAQPHVAAERLDRASERLRWHREHLVVAASDRDLVRRLRRAEGRLQTERQEQLLVTLLRRRFGERNVALWERAVVVALLGVLALLGVDLVVGTSRVTFWCETGLCAFFLWDFVVRAWLIGFQWRWLRRHLVTDFLPALPWTWMLAGTGGGADPARAGWLLRLLRLPRMAQSVRLLVPLMRLVRATGFFMRGLDRLVRSHARLLEREVLLFPTPEERSAAHRRVRAPQATTPLHSTLEPRYRELLEALPEAERGALAEVRSGMLEELVHARDAEGRALARVQPLGGTERRPRRAERPLAEDLLHRLERIDAETVAAELGDESVRRAARGVRLFVRSPLRHLPIARNWVPRASLDSPDGDLVAGAVQAVARSLAAQHGRVLWWADLATTITPAEAVGRVGATLVARTARPAVRLLLVAGLYGILRLLLEIVGDESTLARLVALAERMIGLGLAVLGTICLVLLALGAWLQRLARDASTFQDQVATAQFLNLTDSIKARHRRADAELLAQRVFLPEAALLGTPEALQHAAARFEASLAAFLLDGAALTHESPGHDPVGRAVLLYRDHQGGALFVDTDTRATGQLLGNLALRKLLERSGRLRAADLAALTRIDLVRRRTLFRGPYLWFHAITRALASRAARAIVDFNANAVPLAELPLCTPEERQRFVAWLDTTGPQPTGGARQLTTAFTVLHLLDADPTRDAQIERRFGPRVRARLERERRELVRSVLGCWPLAYRPLEERVLNLRASYDTWLAGGRVFFLPLRVMWRTVRFLGFLGARLVEAVQVIRRPDRPLGAGRPRQADFATALRKVDRMRLPAAWEALRLRARFDPEYLGLDAAGELREGPAPELQRDLVFLCTPPALVEEVELLRERTRHDLAWLSAALNRGLAQRLSAAVGVPVLADPERRRALYLAFHADLDGVRAHLAGVTVVLDAAREVARTSLRPARFVRLGLRGRFARWWHAHGQAAAKAAGLQGAELDQLERAGWTAVSRDFDGARAAFEAVERGEPAAGSEGEARLVALLRHPGQVTEQLTTLRTIQATTLMDVRNYRAHIHRLGQYEDEAPWDEWRALLELGP